MALLCLALLSAGCASPVRGLFPPGPDQPAATVYVLHRGLHAGIIVRAADIPEGTWPEHKEFPQAEYLEAGWGDSQGYRFPWTTRIVLRAMFDSKSSVLLIHAFSGSITAEYSDVAKEIAAVRLSKPGFARLCRFVQDSYALDSRGRPIPLPSIYPDEFFFQATGHYSAIHNCNNWTAGALRAAGCPVRPRWSFLAGIVMFETRRFGRDIWRHGRALAAPALN